MDCAPGTYSKRDNHMLGNYAFKEVKAFKIALSYRNHRYCFFWLRILILKRSKNHTFSSTHLFLAAVFRSKHISVSRSFSITIVDLIQFVLLICNPNFQVIILKTCRTCHANKPTLMHFKPKQSGGKSWFLFCTLSMKITISFFQAMNSLREEKFPM